MTKIQKPRTLLATFSKAQRAKVEHLAHLFLDTPSYQPLNRLRELLGDYARQPFEGYGPTATPNGYLWWRARAITSAVLHTGLVRRLLEDDPQPLRCALFTHGRLSYLCHLVRPFDHLQPHYLPWFDLVGSIVVRDEALLAAYEAAESMFVPDPTEPSLTRIMFGLYHGERGGFAGFRTRLEERIWSPPEVYEQMRLALLAIIDADAARLVSHVGAMAEAHRRQDALAPFHGDLFRYLSVPAHAVFELAQRNLGQLDAQLVARGWDPMLSTAVSNPPTQHLVDFSPVSPVFQSWIDELPRRIDVQQLIDASHPRPN